MITEGFVEEIFNNFSPSILRLLQRTKIFEKFSVFENDGAARRGELVFDRGVINTPVFMPVGTYGTVKGMLPRDLLEVGAEIILGNVIN